MQASFARWVSTANGFLSQMATASSNEAKATRAIDLANHVLSLITDETLRSPQDIIGEHIIPLQNSERFDTWFQSHPDFEGSRSVFELIDGSSPALQAKLYWLKKRSNALMAGAVHFTPNWEDAEWSRNENYKVGIDFFLSPDATSMHVALSNLGKLRVLELSNRLTNTDIEVLEQWEKLPITGDRGSLHSTIWESFKLQSVNAKFYSGIADSFSRLHDHLVASGKKDQEAKMFASRLLGRLIFIWFIRKMRLINAEIEYFEPSGLDQGQYYAESLERLFFRTFNTPIGDRAVESDGTQDLVTPYLSGGLFDPRADDWVGEALDFPEEYFTSLFDHFSEFNFTTDESTPDYEQVAIDPEMLGRVFESLLATQVESTGEQARKAKGAFYTPREVVAYMCSSAIRKLLQETDPNDERWQTAISKLLDTPDQEWARAGSNNLALIPVEIRARLQRQLEELKTFDPACGSGAFPLGMLNLLFSLRLRLDPKLEAYQLKLSILQNNIFGADIEPMAVEISRLRSWLSLIVEVSTENQLEPLPNLEFNFVCANSLLPILDADLFTDPQVQVNLSKVRQEYFAESNPEKKAKLQNQFQKLTAPDLFDERSNQLRTFDPFNSESVAQFFDAETMFGITGGFQLVIANPPYVSAISAKKSLPEEVRASYKREYKSASGAYDLHLLFLELGLRLLSKTGVMVVITPTKYVSAHYGAEFRSLSEESLNSVADFDNAKVFDAAGVSTFVSTFTAVRNVLPITVTKMDLNLNISEARTYPRDSLSKFPEKLWGHLLWGDLGALNKVFQKSILLGDLAEVVASSTAAEADLWSKLVTGSQSASSFKMINTGTIDRLTNDWGDKPYSNKGSKLQTPYLDSQTINARRRDMFSSPKLVVAKLSKHLKATLDTQGEFASSNTVFIMNPSGEYTIESLAGIMNSSTIDYIYRSLFSGLNLLGSFQYQAPQLKLLPLPLEPNAEILKLIEVEVARVRSGDTQFDESNINDLVLALYGLEDDVQQAIKSWLFKY